jgi:coenzyme F420 hydrogenase subunit beta
VGLPCHIQGLRKIQFLGACDWLNNRVVFSLGIFCPTNFFWQYTKHILVEKCGIENFEAIKHLTFHGGATPKHLVVTLQDGKETEIDFFTLLFWGIGNFMHQRCAVCYDWTAEVADISIGDLWEPWLAPGDRGWSTIITRTAIGEQVIHAAQTDNFLYARPTPEDFLVASFAWEIKKHASAYRLAWRSTHTPNPVPDYGYSIDEALALRPAKSAPWRVNSRFHGLISGVPPEEKR